MLFQDENRMNIVRIRSLGVYLSVVKNVGFTKLCMCVFCIIQLHVAPSGTARHALFRLQCRDARPGTCPAARFARSTCHIMPRTAHRGAARRTPPHVARRRAPPHVAPRRTPRRMSCPAARPAPPLRAVHAAHAARAAHRAPCSPYPVQPIAPRRRQPIVLHTPSWRRFVVAISSAPE